MSLRESLDSLRPAPLPAVTKPPFDLGDVSPEQCAAFERACITYGWLRCEFEADAVECDSCSRQSGPIYYRRTCYDVNEGEYYCPACILRRQAEDDEYAAHLMWQEGVDRGALRLD